MTCGICGRDNANILCSKCGLFICEECYDVDSDQCIKCSGKNLVRDPQTQLLGLVTGVMIIMMGVFIASFAFIPLTGAKIVIFPFIFENINSVTAVLMSLMFFAICAMSSTLPLILSIRMKRMRWRDEKTYTINKGNFYGGNVTETVEYMITTMIPETLKDTIFLEESFNEIILLSEQDPGFKKTYKIPDQYSIESLESAYEDQFLVLKIKLYRNQ